MDRPITDIREKYNEAMSAHIRGDPRTGIELLNSVLLAMPDFGLAWNSRASMLQECGHPFDAIMCYDRAFTLSPQAFEIINNRGVAYMDLGMFDRGIEDFKVAIEKLPQLAEPWNNIGNSMMRLGRVHEAVDAYRKALEVRPTYEEARLGLSFALLKSGQFKEGWAEFECRWTTKSMELRNLPFKVWQGEEAQSSDDALLIYGEQGMGDVLQFVRYIPLAKQAWKGKIHVEVRHPLARIVQTMPGIDKLVTLGDRMSEDIAFQAPMLSLPHILNRPEPYWPGEPYLIPDEHRAGLFKKQIEMLPPSKMYVGMCWAGMNRVENPNAAAIDRRRSMVLADFGMLAAPGIAWVGLQTGPPREQIRTPPPNMVIGDFTVDFYDFYDTAAMISNLDLVITVDTAVAHLAAAIGKPTWLLSRFDGCWRWLMDREDTPWYPSMKIYTQKSPGDWQSVMEHVKADLMRELLKKIRAKPALVANSA